MFYKKLSSGKYRYFEKYFDENQGKWRQVTVTMNSKSRVSQSEAKKRLSQKIENRISEVQKKEVDLTLQEVFNEWRIVRDEELKPSTINSELGAFNKLLKEFGYIKISNVSAQKIQHFLLNLKLSSSTRHLRKTYYNLLFSYAKNVGYLDENPMDKVVLPRIKLTQEEIRAKKEKFLNHKEMRKVLDYLYSKDCHFRKALMYEFLFLTGLRIGELLALQWEDCNFEAKNISVRHTLNAYGKPAQQRVLQSPKTIHSYRIVSLNDRCLEILQFFNDECKDEKFIFVGNKGQTYSLTILSVVFKRACKRVLGDRQYNLHMLRHSHISLLVEMNVPIKAIMERVGHSDEKMILQVYSHITPTMHENLLMKLNDFSF